MAATNVATGYLEGMSNSNKLIWMISRQLDIKVIDLNFWHQPDLSSLHGSTTWQPDPLAGNGGYNAQLNNQRII